MFMYPFMTNSPTQWWSTVGLMHLVSLAGLFPSIIGTSEWSELNPGWLAVLFTLVSLVWTGVNRLSRNTIAADEWSDHREDFAKLKAMVELMWEGWRHSMTAEAIGRGAAKKNSPLKLTDKGKGWLEPIATELCSFWNTEGFHLSDPELVVAVQARWGAWLLENVDVAHGLTSATSILMAVLYMRECGEKHENMNPEPPHA